jgi:hypothetical protein
MLIYVQTKTVFHIFALFFIYMSQMVAFFHLAPLHVVRCYLLFAINNILTRTCIYRRLRVFFIPLHQPRRLMRDIRARILALEWIQMVCSLLVRLGYEYI